MDLPPFQKSVQKREERKDKRQTGKEKKGYSMSGRMMIKTWYIREDKVGIIRRAGGEASRPFCSRICVLVAKSSVALAYPPQL
jgi:hypothetical protein